MRMGICNVLIMGGLLMGAGHVLGFLRLHLRDLKLELLDHRELVPLGFQQWYLKACFLFGRMKTGSSELVLLNLQCKD